MQKKFKIKLDNINAGLADNFFKKGKSFLQYQSLGLYNLHTNTSCIYGPIQRTKQKIIIKHFMSLLERNITKKNL